MPIAASELARRSAPGAVTSSLSRASDYPDRVTGSESACRRSAPPRRHSHTSIRQGLRTGVTPARRMCRPGTRIDSSGQVGQGARTGPGRRQSRGAARRTRMAACSGLRVGALPGPPAAGPGPGPGLLPGSLTRSRRRASVQDSHCFSASTSSGWGPERYGAAAETRRKERAAAPGRWRRDSDRDGSAGLGADGVCRQSARRCAGARLGSSAGAGAAWWCAGRTRSGDCAGRNLNTGDSD